jgi:hypothetical protein
MQVSAEMPEPDGGIARMGSRKEMATLRPETARWPGAVDAENCNARHE